MNDADYELIMAYADGETGPEETARAEALLAADPEARATLDQMRATDEALRAALSPTLDEPMPERLTRAAEGRGGSRFVPGPGWAVAASLVVAVAFGTVWFGSQKLERGQALERFVEAGMSTTPSGETHRHPDRGWQLMPLASYRLDDGRLCREYTARTGTGPLAGLACRTSNGQWYTLATESLNRGREYRAASGEQGPVGEALARVEAGEPLSAGAEAELLSEGVDE